VITELVEFFCNEFFILGTFALAVERSILFELLPGPTYTEQTSDLRGWEGSPFRGT
jgi:hypothetical protein